MKFTLFGLLLPVFGVNMNTNAVTCMTVRIVSMVGCCTGATTPPTPISHYHVPYQCVSQMPLLWQSWVHPLHFINSPSNYCMPLMFVIALSQWHKLNNIIEIGLDLYHGNILLMSHTPARIQFEKALIACIAGMFLRCPNTCSITYIC